MSPAAGKRKRKKERENGKENGKERVERENEREKERKKDRKNERENEKENEKERVEMEQDASGFVEAPCHFLLACSTHALKGCLELQAKNLGRVQLVLFEKGVKVVYGEEEIRICHHIACAL